MKILPIIVAIFLYPMALNAFGHGDGHGKGGQDGFRGGGHDGFRGGGRDGGFRGGGRDGDFRGGGRDGGFRRDSRPGSGFRGDGRDGGFRGDSRPGSGWPKSDRLDWPKPDLLDSPKLDRPDWPVPVTPTPPFDIYKTCEPQITQLRSEKEEFMSLLQSSRSSVTTLTTEKNSLVLELSTCNQKYTSIQNDYVEITTVVKNIKSQLQEALNDNTQLKSQWIAANADSRNWKTKCDNLEIDLKRTTESYEQIKITISEYSKMISNLRSTVNEVTVNNNKCGNDNSAWKRKWEEQISKIDTYEESHKFEKITSTVDSRSRSF